MTFLVADGVTPSNEGRGYVLRRIIRRAVQQARTIGLDDLWRISDVVVEQMGAVVPGADGEPRANPGGAPRRGGALHRDACARAEAVRGGAASGAISGEDAFELHATYGFPFELTSELALERGLPVDEDGFRERMAEHRDISRGAGSRAVTALAGAQSEFVGYETPTATGFTLELAQPAYGVAPGQIAALYDGGAVVGCGVVSSAGRN